jgi:hypothetical protein
MISRALRWLCLVALLHPLSCGESGSRDQRPIEVIYYVTGVSGTRFQVEGFQAANADHDLRGREFRTPHFFVLENALQFELPAQPIRGTFQAIDDTIQVFVLFGTQLQERSIELAPGQRATFPCDDLDVDTGECRDGNIPPPTPAPRGPEIRFEICTAAAEGSVDTPCSDLDPPVPPNLAFDVTVGDINGTNVTVCSITAAAVQTCRTATTLFLENPKERVTGVFQKLAGENRDARLRAEIYVNGRLADSDVSRQDAIILDVEL